MGEHVLMAAAALRGILDQSFRSGSAGHCFFIENVFLWKKYWLNWKAHLSIWKIMNYTEMNVLGLKSSSLLCNHMEMPWTVTFTCQLAVITQGKVLWRTFDLWKELLMFGQDGGQCSRDVSCTVKLIYIRALMLAFLCKERMQHVFQWSIKLKGKSKC